MSLRSLRGRLTVLLGVVAAAVLVVAAVPAGARPALGGCPAGATLTTVQVAPPSGVHVTDDRVDVLLPPGYCGSGLRYPVLYLLHGTGDQYNSWTAHIDLLAYEQAARFPVVMVMPDAGHGTTAGWYSNWLDGSYQWETYHTVVLPQYVNSHFRTLPNDVAVAGLSMGGFGALSYAARHPRMFRAAASFSGAVDMLYGAPATGTIFTALHSQYGTPNDEVWGSQVTDSAVWAQHNPTSLAAALAGVKLFLASGTGTPGGAQGDDPADVGDYGLEHGLFQMNLSLVRALDLAGVAHTDRFYPGGYHGWPYWQADLHWALPQIMSILGGARP